MAQLESLCSLPMKNNQRNLQRRSLQLMYAILIWRKTKQDYGQYLMYHSRSQKQRRNFTPLQENPQLVASLSVKIDITYGEHTSIGFATVVQYRKMWNILGLSRCFKDGHRNYSDVISQYYIEVRRLWEMSMHSLGVLERYFCIPICSKYLTQ